MWITRFESLEILVQQESTQNAVQNLTFEASVYFSKITKLWSVEVGQEYGGQIYIYIAHTHTHIYIYIDCPSPTLPVACIFVSATSHFRTMGHIIIVLSTKWATSMGLKQWLFDWVFSDCPMYPTGWADYDGKDTDTMIVSLRHCGDHLLHNSNNSKKKKKKKKKKDR